MRRGYRSINGIGLVARSNFLFKARRRLFSYKRLFLLIDHGYFTTVLYLDDCFIFEIFCRTTNILIK